MTRHTTLNSASLLKALLAVGLVATVLAGALVAGASTAAGQATATPANTTVVEQVDDRLRVTSYRYDDEADTVYITLESTGDEHSSVTVTEAISRAAAKSGRFGIKQISVGAGETVTVEVRTYSQFPIGVLVTTQESIQQGHGTFLPLRTGGGGVIKGDPTGAQVRMAVLSTGFITLLAVFGGAWHYVANRYEGTFEAPIGIPDGPLIRRLLRRGSE